MIAKGIAIDFAPVSMSTAMFLIDSMCVLLCSSISLLYSIMVMLSSDNLYSSLFVAYNIQCTFNVTLFVDFTL